jgi:uncharacterized protein (TIGR03437 family)
MSLASLAPLALSLSAILVAQTAPSPLVVMSGGYDYPLPVYLAPGQVLTWFVAGLPLRPAFSRAVANPDLPTTLEGISAGMTQFQPPAQPGPAKLVGWKLPILEVRPFGTCIAPTFGCSTTTAAITVQVPFEMLSIYDACEKPGEIGCLFSEPGFGVIVNEQGSYGFEVIALPDQIHIVKTYDSIVAITNTPTALPCGKLTQNSNSAPVNGTGLPCPPFVTHADGSLVSASSPARPGEEIIAYAVGLGQTTPPSITGRLVTASARTATEFVLDFNYRPNALAAKPPAVGTPGVSHPTYSGTTPGSVGLYQVNFIVPPVPRGTPACSIQTSQTRSYDNFVFSNLTVSVGGRFSFDGAGICVAVDSQ